MRAILKMSPLLLLWVSASTAGEQESEICLKYLGSAATYQKSLSDEMVSQLKFLGKAELDTEKSDQKFLSVCTTQEDLETVTRRLERQDVEVEVKTDREKADKEASWKGPNISNYKVATGHTADGMDVVVRSHSFDKISREWQEATTVIFIRHVAEKLPQPSLSPKRSAPTRAVGPRTPVAPRQIQQPTPKPVQKKPPAPAKSIPATKKAR